MGRRDKGRWEPRGFGSGPSVNPYTVLLALLALGITAGVVHNRLDKAGRVDPALAAVRGALFPFQKGASAVRGGFSFDLDWLLRGRRVQSENVRLRAENDRLRLENERLVAQAAEVGRLRSTLGLIKDAKKPPLAADVLGLLPSPHFDTVIVGRGTRDGVRERMVARTADGLVGQVIETGPISCEVMLLTDFNSGVGALVRRPDGKLIGVGIVQGVGRDKPLEVQYLKREAPVKKGDKVYSSGYGGVIPPDLPIGVVVDVKTEDARFLKKAIVAPYAPLPGDLREVLLLR